MGGQLEFDLLNVYKKPISENVTITLRHQKLGLPFLFKGVNASNHIALKDAMEAGVYKVEIDPPSFLPVERFLNVQEGQSTVVPVTFPVDPKRVRSVEFQDYDSLAKGARACLDASNGVLGYENKNGRALYEALDNIKRAGLCNIVSKCEHTVLANGKSVLEYVQELVEIRGDRFYARVPKELREETRNSVPSGVFEPAGEALHHPPKGYEHARSFKTRDSYGNLQLTFWMSKKDEVMADIDIDDAGGLMHVFQVARNFLTGKPTHPYDIHELLIIHQTIDPGYILHV